MIGTGVVLVAPKISQELVVAWSTVFAAYDRALREGAIDGRKVPDERSFVLAVLSRLPTSHWQARAAQMPTSPTIDDGSRSEDARRVEQTRRFKSADELRYWVTAALPWGTRLLDAIDERDIHTVTTGLVLTSTSTNQEIRTVGWSELFVAYESAVAAGAIDQLPLSDLTSVVRILLKRLPTEKKMLPNDIVRVPIDATANPVQQRGFPSAAERIQRTAAGAGRKVEFLTVDRHAESRAPLREWVAENFPAGSRIPSLTARGTYEILSVTHQEIMIISPKQRILRVGWDTVYRAYNLLLEEGRLGYQRLGAQGDFLCSLLARLPGAESIDGKAAVRLDRAKRPF
jgi:hypothetical protein